MLLQASQDDLVRGAVQKIKCRLCPGSNIKTFDEFKRHCRTAETHPLEILFCDLLLLRRAVLVRDALDSLRFVFVSNFL